MKMMKQDILYYSTNLKAQPVAFSEALIKGLAPDKGLFMPETIPHFNFDEIKTFASKTYPEIAFSVLQRFLGDQISDQELHTLTHDAYNFPVPLENVAGRKYVMRLDQGPTASFKDFAARMMGRLMQYFLKKDNRNLLILTATSGDTGSAMANAFYGLDNIKIVILFPENEVSDRQRRQMTTLRQNVQTIALNGKFDDCQALVKQAFSDSDLEYLNLSSANSINIGRLLPQSIYYFYAYSRLSHGESNDEAIFSVPSGNFGDLMGGLLAKKMGLPVKKFVISTNENDEVPNYFKTGAYQPIVPSKNCLSSAMNVGHPSNLARIVALYKGAMNEKGEILKSPDMTLMKQDMFAISISDSETIDTIKKAYNQYKLVLEPHGAVSWAGLKNYLDANPQDNNDQQLCISLETAHPAKFPDALKEFLHFEPSIPGSLQGLEDKTESFDKLENSYKAFKSYLKEHF
ncbi:MAG: threonine synthase [Bacteroidota bacterium]|nr:threonine synthase [Bacteroidota bacterium]MDP4226711.1 threonine synthase [Bacteroidota bacterium]